MAHMACSITYYAAKKNILWIIDKICRYISDGILAFILLSLFLLLLRGLSLPKDRGGCPWLKAGDTKSLVGREWVLLLRESNAPAALENEIIVPDLRGKMIAGVPRTQALLMI